MIHNKKNCFYFQKKVHPDMVGSWGRLEVGSGPSSNLGRRWNKSCGQKMGQPGLKTGAPSSDQGLVGRWGTADTLIYQF